MLAAHFGSLKGSNSCNHDNVQSKTLVSVKRKDNYLCAAISKQINALNGTKISNFRINPLSSLWCCSDTMDPLGLFWALAPLKIGLQPWNQVHLKENWILRKVVWFLATLAKWPLKEVAQPFKYISSRKLNLNLFYIR